MSAKDLAKKAAMKLVERGVTYFGVGRERICFKVWWQSMRGAPFSISDNGFITQACVLDARRPHQRSMAVAAGKKAAATSKWFPIHCSHCPPRPTHPRR